jgi:hypothetical protein
MPDLSLLFARDPLDLTREDLAEIVDKMRASRKAFNLGNAKAGSTKPKTEKQKAADELASKLKITL